MSVHDHLAVQYHQQDTNYYCGAACAQMVLAEIGAGLLDQDDLYADNHSHSVTESGWYTAPDGLNWTLNARRPASFGNCFVVFALSSEDLISRKICWTIHHYQVAPVAMVFGSAHWIVGHGLNPRGRQGDCARLAARRAPAVVAAHLTNGSASGRLRAYGHETPR